MSKDFIQSMLAMAVLSAILPNSARAGQWVKMPLLSPEQARQGIHPGGEGGQWFRDLVISRSHPDFLMLAIDVAGLYRTFDGGGHWEHCNVGWDARGANALAIDPFNPRRVLGVGGNSMDWQEAWGPSPHGIYLSQDQAASWHQVLRHLDGPGAAYGGQGEDPHAREVSIAWDPSSYDKKSGHCLRAFYLPQSGGLYRSDDGGETWKQIFSCGGNTRLKVGPGGELVLAGRAGRHQGLWLSRNGGESFEPRRKDPLFGLDVEHGILWVSGPKGIERSLDWGKTFQRRAGPHEGGTPWLNVTASPADPKALAAWTKGDSWNWRRWISRDGGAHWQESRLLGETGVLPANVRQGHWAFHPKDPKQVYAYGGDWVSRSVDGGRTFAWRNNGYSGIMLGGSFGFGSQDPGHVFLAFQDYNGALTGDGGKTWDYMDVSGKGWGGMCYAGQARDLNLLWYGDSDSWGGERYLRLSRDGGKSWSFPMDGQGGKLPFKGPDVSFSHPGDLSILFASNWRSPDGGETWHSMRGCDAVYAAWKEDGWVLAGSRAGALVLSRDGGETWRLEMAVPGGFSDLAWDGQAFWLASEDRLKVLAKGRLKEVDTPVDQMGRRRIRTVAVDPRNPLMIYAGAHADIYATNTAVLQSTDGGRTWKNLTVNQALAPGQRDGPREVGWLRVHPQTGELWAAGQCYGMWRYLPQEGAASGL